VAIRALATKYSVPLHCDGARLYEASPYYEQPLAKIAELFDSIYISFYKGFGAMTGAMLLGTKDFVRKASTWQRRLGGNPYTMHPYALSSRAAFRTHADSFKRRWDKTKGVVAAMRSAAATSGCKDMLCFQPEVPTCCQLQCFLLGEAAELQAARDDVQEQTGERLFGGLRHTPLHLRKRFQAMGRVPEDWMYFELTVGPQHLEIDDSVFEKAWSRFFEAVRASRRSQKGVKV